MAEAELFAFKGALIYSFDDSSNEGIILEQKYVKIYFVLPAFIRVKPTPQLFDLNRDIISHFFAGQ